MKAAKLGKPGSKKTLRAPKAHGLGKLGWLGNISPQVKKPGNTMTKLFGRKT